jgi:hypothetical protein
MESDNSWSVNPQRFVFEARAGKKTDAIEEQIGKGGRPGLVVSTIGGNNAFFGEIVRSCIYQPRFRGYGDKDTWEDDQAGTGRCKSALRQASNHVDDFEAGLRLDFKSVIDDILNSNAAHARTSFWLWIMSYAQFFDATTDDCDKWSFASGQYSGTQPHLLKGLRKEMNANLLTFTEAQVCYLLSTALFTSGKTALTIHQSKRSTTVTRPLLT